MLTQAPEFPTRLGWYVVSTPEQPPVACMFMPSDGPDRGEVLCGHYRYPALDERLAEAVYCGPFPSRAEAEREADAASSGRTISLDAFRATA
jgi:hypothetical protein